MNMQMADIKKAVNVAFSWHMHQPSYKGPIFKETGMLDMPWVRLHASHSYYDMLIGLKQKPTVKMTFNYSGILLEQVVASAEALKKGQSPDINHYLSAKDPEKLTHDEMARMRATFFFGNRSTMIDPYPRYRELMDKSNRSEAFSPQDILDLQVLSNLSWIGPFLREENAFVEDLISQGRDFTVHQKKRVLDLQAAALIGLVPTLKELQESGQIEISVTPHFHPILPMLIDSNVADAEDLRPMPPFAFKEDAIAQVKQARDLAEKLFGVAPEGIWPAEGAVSRQAAKVMLAQGFSWIMTSDSVLEKSLARELQITERFLPWKYEGGSLIFRDTGLSNAISFKYKEWNPFGAAQDLIINLLGIKEVCNWPVPPLVTLMLDGENPWEHYRDKGFVRELLNALEYHEKQNSLITTTPSRYLAENERVQFNQLPKLQPGTWADNSFRTWLGNDLTKRMWEALRAARSAADEFACSGETGEEFQGICDKALAILHAAEGSDTFWWAGPFHETPQLGEFDGIFREKLRQVYDLIGKPVPDYLNKPFLDVPKVQLDVRPRIQSEPVITIDPSSTRLLLPKIGGQMRSLVVEPGTGMASLIEFRREPKGEMIVHEGEEKPVMPITHRTDPLGRDVTTVISLFRSQRPQPIRTDMKKQENKCVFCDPEGVAGPLVMADHAYAGKNLFAFLDYHEVLALARHVEYMAEIELNDITALTELLHSRIFRITGQEKFNRIIAGWNFGGKNKPWDSGASIEHMHMQLGFIVDPLLIQPDPVAETVDAYFREQLVDLFEYYYTALKRAKLVVWEDENFVLYAPFAPKFKDQLEIFAKDPRVRGFINTTPGLRRSLEHAMFLAVRGLKELRVPVKPGDESNFVDANIQSFNANFFQSDLNDKRPNHRLWMEIDPRQSQIAFAEIRGLYVVDRHPEDSARFMRMALGSSVNTDVQSILAGAPLPK